MKNLQCNESESPDELIFLWERPGIRGEGVTDYQVEIKGLRQKDGSKDVESFDIAAFSTKMEEASLSEGLG